MEEFGGEEGAGGVGYGVVAPEGVVKVEVGGLRWGGGSGGVVVSLLLLVLPFGFDGFVPEI